jgi:hypothetical protein
LAVTFTTGAAFWLKAEHTPSAPIALAQAFVNHLHAKRYDQAHQLTLQNGYTGKTSDELRAISARQLCPITRYVRIFPFQSNGNRLRRLLAGAEIEMPEIQLFSKIVAFNPFTFKDFNADGFGYSGEHGESQNL